MLRRAWNRIDFAASSAWQNFWRNAAVSVASVLIVWVVLLALGSLLLVLHSLDQIVALEKSRASAISVYLADNTPLTSIMDFKLHLEHDPRVTAVTYVTKDQAMARFRQMPALDPQVIDSLGTNPLPASLDVTVKDIRDLGAIDQEVRNSPLVDKSPATNYEPSVIDKIVLLARVAGFAGLALIIGLTGLSVFIIMLTIRTAIYLRRKEIEVMKLVGATDWFVRWPFIVEGLIVGVAGAVVAVAIVGLGYRPAVQNLQSVLIFVPLSYDPVYLRLVLAAMMAFGLLLGTVGSYLGVRRFLRQ
jgi:cell division transport system permease protein